MRYSKVYALNFSEGNETHQALYADIASALSEASVSLESLSSCNCLLSVKTGTAMVVHGNEEVSFDDAYVFIRTRGEDQQGVFTSLLCMVFSLLGIPYLDPANAHARQWSNKSFCVPRLALAGIPVPRTLIANQSGFVANRDYLRTHIKYPCVLKGNGERGEAVFKIADETMLFATLADLAAVKQQLFSVQELIPNEYDVRALYLGPVCIASMRRYASPGEFHNNISQGGSARPDQMSTAEHELCQRAVRVSGVDFCGIDFIRTNEGIVFLEVNKSPQLHGIRSLYPDLSVGKSLLSYLSLLSKRED